MAIRHYRLSLTTVGPLHIGSGGTYGKRDYFRLDNRRVGVLDVVRFVSKLDVGERDDYCRFLESGAQSDGGLTDYLERHPNLESRARSSVAYEAEMTLAKARRGTYLYHDVLQCVKDVDGQPYVPGSSVKGMLRTALLAHIIQSDCMAYEAELRLAFQSDQDRKSKNADRNIEGKAFWVEKLGKDGSVIQDIMRHVSVSDSAPLPVSNLVFAKKYDKFSRNDLASHKLAMGKMSKETDFREGNALNIYRECIRPGATIDLALDVDERIDAYLNGLVLDCEGLTKVLEEAYELYSRSFLDHFDLESVSGLGGTGSSAASTRCGHVYSNGMQCRNTAINGTGYCSMHQDDYVASSKSITCYLGGGVDYIGKTVMSALTDKDRDGVYEISRVLYAQFPTKLDPVRHSELESEIREAGFAPSHMRSVMRGNKLIRGKNDHRHWKDAELGVSPHTLKLGIVDGKKYLMGRCNIAIGERS